MRRLYGGIYFKFYNIFPDSWVLYMYIYRSTNKTNENARQKMINLPASVVLFKASTSQLFSIFSLAIGILRKVL